MKRMLINATQQEELRMAMVDGQRLYDLNIEGPASERKKANIYKGKITRIEPSLEAAFVDYGSERHGFLPLKEVSPEYFVREVESGKKPSIRDVLKEGQDIVVQIDKEERGNKGAALTTYVSLAGRFIVLKPNKARSGGVSRRIVGEDRDLARQTLREIDVPDGMSVIVRTAGIDRGAEELAWDLETLMKVWQAILDHVLQRPAPFLLYRESNSVIRALRDYLTNEIGEILIDDEATFKEAHEFVEQVMPHNVRKLKLYADPVPLFTRFQIESQIESAFAHSVSLPSGGSIVIDHTEALVSIDINSARATKGGDIEATALNTNLEAAEEIARQLRIRDLGGLVVIDFIDMGPQKNQRAVENRLREAVRQDRARVQIGKITRFGLLEMSRQRLRPSIGESAYQTCPRCSGFGTIRSIESLALAILRIVGEEARKERTAKVIAQLPVEVATYLLNEKRDWVQGLEISHDTQVVLVANPSLETPHYDVRRVRDDQTELPENAGVSYTLVEAEAEAAVPTSIEERKVAEQAAIDVIKPSTPAPRRAETGGFFAWLKGLFTPSEKPKKKKTKKTRTRKAASRDTRSRRGGQRRGRKDQPQRGDVRQRQTKKKTKKKSASKARKKGGERKAAAGGDTQGQPQSAGKGGESQGGEKRSPRNRRSRGGRRRRRSSDRQKPDAETQTNKQSDAPQAGAAPSKTKPTDAPAAETRPSEAAKLDAKTADAGSARRGDGPPKARTDAERATDAQEAKARSADSDARTRGNGSDTAPAKSPASHKVAPKEPAAEKQPPQAKPERQPESRPAEKREPKAESKPESRPVEKREPKAESKPESMPAKEREPRAESKPESMPAKVREPSAEPKPEPKPKPPSEPKPEGRLLPWDTPAAPTIDKPAKPAADSPDQG